MKHFSILKPANRAVWIAGFLIASLLPAGAVAASKPAHSARFSSYRITTIAEYNTQPDQNLPGSAVATIGRHAISTRMVVRDSSHYRVDVQTIAPAIDSGTLTVSLDGRRMVAYDIRTGLAAWNTISGSGSPQPGDIQIGSALSPMAPTPDPGQSFNQYLAMLHQPSSVIHPTVLIVGHTRLLGHPVAIIEYGPLIGTGQSLCARPSRRTPHPMCHSTSGTGFGRLWVATDRPVLLKYTEGHFAGLPGGMTRQHYLYRVTSFHFGPVPLAATRHPPPVPISRSQWLETAAMGGGDSGWFGGWPENWRTGILYRAPPPQDSHGNLYTENSVFLRRDTLEPIPTAMGVLYYRPTASSTGLPPAQYQGSGPYVYLQERIQVHGLPAALRTGRHIQRGRCSLWTGSYRKNLPWLALARRRVSLLVTTNSLSQEDLIQYALRRLCG